MTPARVAEIRQLLDRGLTAPEIGKLLGVSRSTAYTYVRQVRDMQKWSATQFEEARG